MSPDLYLKMAKQSFFCGINLYIFNLANFKTNCTICLFEFLRFGLGFEAILNHCVFFKSEINDIMVWGLFDKYMC